MRLLAALALAAALLVGGGTSSSAPVKRPNIVFVLTDDLSWDLVRFMPHVQAMQKDGVTFSRYYVTDSLCCPSRSSIFSGRFPHNTGVFTNMAPDGGFGVFNGRGEERSTWATSLQGAGYRTAMMGKYLNGYEPAGLVKGKPLYIPPGWNEWDVAGNGYPEFNYNLNENGKLVHYGNQPQDYLTDVISGKAVSFINQAAADKKPFAIELATFAPHSPFTPAPRDANDFPGLNAPRDPSFNKPNTNAPRWLAARRPLKPKQVSDIDVRYRFRARAVQAVDDMIASIESTLQARGIADNTYVVFSSDNGFHMGQHELAQGKMTAFETDIRVPLVVVGPGVPSGKTISAIAENIDLRPTFSQLAGARIPSNVDGSSLVPFLRGRNPKGWRGSALVEHHGPDRSKSDPDAPGEGSGNPSSYEALRSGHFVYVEYKDGEREYYNLARDPYERHNTYNRLKAKPRSRLHNALRKMRRCKGRACSAAQSLVPGP